MENSYLDQLNPEQQQAVLHNEGHLLIVAGPGTGKTHTLAAKIAYLIQNQKVDPRYLIAITFTHKAGEQLQQRIQNFLPHSPLPFIGTFHSFCLQLLKIFLAEQHNRLHILTEKEQQEILKKIMEELSTGTPSLKVLRKLQQSISRLKNGETPFSTALFPEEIFKAAYQRYQQTLKDNCFFDYDDLIIAAIEYLQKSHPQKLQYIFIDEYQDLNALQYQLLHVLIGPSTQICAIGDPDQAIYSFRGSKPEYFLRFQNDFPNTTILALQTNYRSSENILKTANQLIINNTQRLHKTLKTTQPQGQAVALCSFQDSWKEAIFIAKHITRLVGGVDMLQTDQHHTFSSLDHYNFSDIAILCRTNHQGRSIAETLKKENIPHQLITSLPWHQKNEIQLILSFFQLFQNPTQQVYQELFQQFAPKLHLHFTTQQIAHLLQTLSQQPTHTFTASEWTKTVSKLLHLEEIFHDGTTKGEKRWQNLQLFFSVVLQFDNVKGEEALQALIEYCTLLQHHDTRLKYEGVAVMTLHASKGLEFEVVFIPGLNDGVFPVRQTSASAQANEIGSRGSQSSEAELIEEERRLFYVGLTRAKKQLYLSYTTHNGEQKLPPSPFLKEIESQLTRPSLLPPISKRKLLRKQQMKLF